MEAPAEAPQQAPAELAADVVAPVSLAAKRAASDVKLRAQMYGSSITITVNPPREERDVTRRLEEIYFERICRERAEESRKAMEEFAAKVFGGGFNASAAR